MSVTLEPLTPTADAVAQLRLQLAGIVHAPADLTYDDARLAWNLSVGQAPALVVEPVSADDVVVALRFARATGLPVAVQTTGHGLARAADGALLINLRRLDGVSVDPAARRARLGGGATWGPVLAQAQRHGLAPLLGSAPHVGAVGYTLGGGMGWLARRHGLSADLVHSIDLATADGTILTVTRDRDAELFWALLGGGAGTLGVVTAMEVELVEVTTVTAGNLFYPGDQAREVMARFREWVSDAPADLTAAVSVMNFPSLDVVPEALRGRTFTIVRGCHCGDAADAEKQLAFWRDWRAPAIDMFGPMPFTEIATVSQDPVDPVPGASSAELLTDLPDDLIDSIVRHTTEQPGPPILTFTEIRHLGGAIGTGDNAASDALRDARFVAHSVGVTATSDDAATVMATLASLHADLRRHGTGHAYLNFLELDERRHRVRDAFGEAGLERLRAVKHRVDALGRFDHGYDLAHSEVA